MNCIRFRSLDFGDHHYYYTLTGLPATLKLMVIAALLLLQTSEQGIHCYFSNTHIARSAKNQNKTKEKEITFLPFKVCLQGNESLKNRSANDDLILHLLD